MSKDRLNGLASFNMRRGINEDVTQVINAFFSIPRSINVLKQGFSN